MLFPMIGVEFSNQINFSLSPFFDFKVANGHFRTCYTCTSIIIMLLVWQGKADLMVPSVTILWRTS